MTDPFGVIVMGGRASRMGGGDKGLLLAHGRTLLSYVIDRIAPATARLALSANGDPARLAHLGLPVLPDAVCDAAGDHGPLAGVLAGLDWAARHGADCIVTVPADTPFLPRDLVARLRAAAGAGGLAAAASPGGPQPLCALWPVRLTPALRLALRQGTRRIAAVQQAHHAATARFATDAPFFNVNTPADLATARALLADQRT